MLTQNTLYPQAKGEVSVAVGDWSLDEHMTGKYAVPAGGGKLVVQLEGNFWPSVGPSGNWYDTPFAIMLPKRGVGSNLLVPVAVSASAVAFSSTRIENWRALAPHRSRPSPRRVARAPHTPRATMSGGLPNAAGT